MPRWLAVLGVSSVALARGAWSEWWARATLRQRRTGGTSLRGAHSSARLLASSLPFTRASGTRDGLLSWVCDDLPPQEEGEREVGRGECGSEGPDWARDEWLRR